MLENKWKYCIFWYFSKDNIENKWKYCIDIFQMKFKEKNRTIEYFDIFQVKFSIIKGKYIHILHNQMLEKR